jgi:hypothetical protein
MTMDEPVGNRQHDDSRKTHIYDLIDTPGDRLEYVYDYGDNWIHSIELKGMTKHPQSFLGKSPGVLAGSMACPPEDCGGINAYNEFLAWKLFKTPPQYHSEITEYLKDHDIWNPELRGLAFMDSSVKRLLREIDKD